MKLLILGGTIFLGRHLVEAALARGHQITLFNRGRHNPRLFPAVEKLRGDRDSDLTVLRGRRWDAVIDTSGYLPRHVRASAELLAGAVDHYTFISSISVYADLSRPGVTERAPLSVLPEGTTEELTAATYGPLKVLCERAVDAALPGRALQVRPGLIVGPHDPTGRFTYWPLRVAQGGEILAPGHPDRPVQFIDARDLAGWIVRQVESRQTGVFNATRPAGTLTWQRLLEECQVSSDSDARVTWVDDEFLLDAGVTPWTELPLWMAERDGSSVGFMRVNCDRAIAAGLTFRPLGETIRDTLAWATTAANTAAAGFQDTAARAVGLEPWREQRLLEQWHQQRDQSRHGE